jgi:hypothetical protein
MIDSQPHLVCAFHVCPPVEKLIPAPVLSSENQIFLSILILPLQQLEAQDSAHLKTPTTSLCRRTVIESIPEKVSKSRFTTISQ